MALRPVKKYITIGENTGEGSTMEHWDRLWPGGYTFAYADGLFRPSTDTFLLGAFPRLRRGMTVCDLGAGTGLLGLLLLAREPELLQFAFERMPSLLVGACIWIFDAVSLLAVDTLIGLFA